MANISETPVRKGWEKLVLMPTVVFLNECVELTQDSDCFIVNTDLYKLYVDWAKANKEEVISSRKFHREVRDRLSRQWYAHGVTTYRGVKVKERV